MTLNNEFTKLICKIQDNENITDKELHRIGKIIKEKKLISKCKDSFFAKQLCMKNNIPRKYWSDL